MATVESAPIADGRIERELYALRELLEAKIAAVTELQGVYHAEVNRELNRRFEGAAVVANERLGVAGARFQTTVELINEKLHGMETRLIDHALLCDTRFKDGKAEVAAALASAERAVGKAEVATEKRFEGVNEFRKTLSDQSATMVQRTEVDTRFRAIDTKFSEMSSFPTRDELYVTGQQVSKLELEVRTISGMLVRREDLGKLSDSLEKLRDNQSTNSGKSIAMGQVVTAGLAVMAIMVSLIGFMWHGPSSPSPPVVYATTPASAWSSPSLPAPPTPQVSVVPVVPVPIPPR